MSADLVGTVKVVAAPTEEPVVEDSGDGDVTTDPVTE